MAPALRHLPASSTAAEIAAIIRSDGAVVIDRLVSPETMDAAIDELGPHIDRTPYSGDDFGGRRTKRTGALIARSETCRELVTHPLIRETVGDVLGHASNYQVHLTQVISIEPGQGAQPIHRDQWAFDFFPFPSGYDVQCNTIWAATDFTEDNGATRVVPQSNTAEDRLRFDFADSVPAEMPAGSVLVYSGSVYHGGGANNSEAVRRGINLTYNLAWLRQEENQYLSVPLDVARTLDDDLLKLMGYSMGAYALGYVGDVQNPLDALRGTPGRASLSGDEITALRAPVSDHPAG